MMNHGKHPRVASGTPAMAPHETRSPRAALFQAFVLGASAIFVVLAVLAHRSPYFPIDLAVTRALQRHESPALDTLMYALTWLGFLPQIAVLGSIVILALFFAGLRFEAVALVFAACGAGLTMLVKFLVYRPRPSTDLVHVLNMLASPSFPSGHVVMFTVFCGFLLFLAYTLLKPSWLRRVLLVGLGLLIGLMGPSRIYLGQHWFSDVMGAYLLGSLWLALTIKFYWWGKPRFFTGRPASS